MNFETFSWLLILCAATAKAQWTPDPFCPYPSNNVTRYPYYGNCSVYWECYEGTKSLQECLEGLEFNALLQQCDAPEIANCDPDELTTENPNPTTYIDDTTSDGPHPTCPWPSEELVYFPFPGDCTKYWECYEGNSYLYTCPEGLWWHEEISECDYPGDFCDNSTTSTSDGTTSSEVTTVSTPDSLCPYPSDQIIYFPYPGDCTKYLECYEGEASIHDCLEGLWWHEEISECDIPGDYCEDSTDSTSDETTGATDTTGTTSSEVTTDSTPDSLCPYPSDEIIYFPYPGNCTKYLECYEGEESVQDCPEGLWWHQEISECDYPGDFCVSSLL